MKKTLTGVIIAAVVLYLWGFLFWGFGPYGTLIWKQTGNDTAAGAALLQHFPENGTYYVPGFGNDPEALEGLFSQGPVAFVHMLSTTGRSMHDSTMMIEGFVVNLLFVIVLAAMISSVRSSVPAFRDRLKLIALAGLAAVVLIDFGDVVWWQIDGAWKLYQACYDFSAVLITGMILAKFIEPGIDPGSHQATS